MTSFDVELYRRLVETSPEGVVLVDAQNPDRPVVYANAGFEALTGYPAAELIGKNLRLLQGDVGSGKTIVALFACAAAIAPDGQPRAQAALMAPTEILARQHHRTIVPLAAAAGIRIAILTGRERGAERTDILERLARGEIDLLIGTHALYSDDVVFADLALAVVDEQHRFGVEQRGALITKHATRNLLIPHFLSMTATPIPRTLALTVYGDLDVSVLDEIPSSRKKIITRIVKPGDRQQAYEFIRAEIAKGGQVFVVCPQIESRITNHES